MSGALQSGRTLFVWSRCACAGKRGNTSNTPQHSRASLSARVPGLPPASDQTPHLEREWERREWEPDRPERPERLDRTEWGPACEEAAGANGGTIRHSCLVAAGPCSGCTELWILQSAGCATHRGVPHACGAFASTTVSKGLRLRGGVPGPARYCVPPTHQAKLRPVSDSRRERITLHRTARPPARLAHPPDLADAASPGALPPPPPRSLSSLPPSLLLGSSASAPSTSPRVSSP